MRRRTPLFAALVTAAWLLTALPAVAQVPGDGVPDLYFFSRAGLVVETSLGPVTRPAGTLLLDTDVSPGGGPLDIIYVLVGSPSVGNSCDLCDGEELPIASPTTVSSWIVGHFEGAMHWIREAPLGGGGFRGVIGTGFFSTPGDTLKPWPDDVPPFIHYPKSGLAIYHPRFHDGTFPKVIERSDGEWFSAFLIDVDGEEFWTDVTVVLFTDGFESGDTTGWSATTP